MHPVDALSLGGAGCWHEAVVHLGIRMRVLPGPGLGLGAPRAQHWHTPCWGGRGRLEKAFPVLHYSESFATGSVNFIAQLILSFIGSGDLSIFLY